MLRISRQCDQYSIDAMGVRLSKHTWPSAFHGNHVWKSGRLLNVVSSVSLGDSSFAASDNQFDTPERVAFIATGPLDVLSARTS